MSKTTMTLVALLTAAACGGDSNSDAIDAAPAIDAAAVPAVVTYSTTSSKGDYAEWTLEDDTLSATWVVVTDTGATAVTWDITATCLAPDATFNVRECTITSAPCTPGVAVCGDDPAGNVIDLTVVPGVALFVNATGSGIDDQLLIGFAKDSGNCDDDISGTYTYVRTGLGLNELFGMFVSDANLQSVTASSFGVDSAGPTATPDVAYRTGGGTGTGIETFSGTDCTDGVRERTNAGNDIRAMITEGGLFVMDLPAGEGGLLAFDVSRAASIGDWANREFTGISFPDNGPPSRVVGTTGAAASDSVSVTVGVGVETGEFTVRPFSNPTSTSTDPSYPDLTAVPGGYTSNSLQATYPSPSTFPGMYRIEPADDIDDEGRVFAAAMVVDSKLIVVGYVYNWRDETDIDPSSGDGSTFPVAGLYNTGNFLLFEK